MPHTPPKLLHVFPTFIPAGAQVRTVQLMDALGDAFQHQVLALDGHLEALELVTRAHVEPVRMDPPRGPRAALRVLGRLRPDGLLTYNWGSFDWVLAARLSGSARHLHHEDGFNADEANRQKLRRVWARRLVLRRARRVIVPSRRLWGIARETWRLPEELLRLIPNGVSLERFGPDPAGGREVRARLGIPSPALVVGAVGHLRPVKNFARLLRACARLPRELATPGVHLLLLGDGEERASLEGLAALHAPPGGRVHLAGHQADLAPWYGAMDVLAISSDSEQLPMSLLEAMAAGVPVVGTDVGDVGHVLPEEGRAHLVPLEAADVEGALATSLGALLADPERRASLARSGRERAQREYSFETMRDAYAAEYERAAAGR